MEFFKKISIALVVSISILALTIIGLIDLENNNKTRAVTIKSPEVITMDSRRISYQPILIAPYKDMDVFMSEEKSPGFEFTSVGGSWNEISAEGTNVEAEVKFKVDDVWTEWISMEEELDPKSGKKYAMASSDPATSIKYRFILYGDGKNSPVVKDIDWTFIKAAKKVSLESIEKPRYSSFVALAKDPTGVINRSNWGADESYRYLSDNNLDYPLAELDAEFYEKYFDELQYSRVVETDENGDKYKWPLQYPEKVKKVIIHHTATTKNLDNPAQAIRDIYHYHAVTRGWGDIGYNYLVDLEGNIYEGRYGGEGVIGAHSGPGNHGSIGVAILGNYQETPVPEEVLTKLSQFIYKKSKIHGIDTDAMSLFRGDLMYNIFGHKDIMSTACPGDYLYNKLPIIRGIAAQDTEQKEKFVKDYDYQNKSDLYYLELKPNENIDVTVKMENIGKIDWNEETFIVVDQNPAFDGVISFPTKVDATLAMMEETEVKPGETATFNFQIKAATTGETVYMNIAPLANGEKKINDYFVLPVAVQQPVYKYQFIEAKFPGNLMKTEEEFKAWVKLKNTGNVIWEDISLESENTSSIPKEGAVGQEEIATFEFTFSSPGKAGYFKESLIPTISIGLPRYQFHLRRLFTVRIMMRRFYLSHL